MAVLTLSEKLDQLGARYDELTQQLSTQELVSDSSRFQKVAKQHAELQQIVAKHREYKQIDKDLAGAHQLYLEAEDSEMKQLAHDEEKQLAARKETVERELKLLLLPKDPNDERSVIVEIRAGTGGDEAAIFAGDLFRMYSRYSESLGWKVEVLESSPSSLGGVKEIVAAIQGNKVYSKLKYESGVHRVHRRGPAGSRRHRHQNRSQRLARRYLLLFRPRRPVREHHVLCSAYHAHSQRPGRLAAGRKIANQKSRQGHARSPRPSLRNGARETASRRRRRASRPNQDRRPLGKDPHLQLPAKSRNRSPHRLDPASTDRGDGRKASSHGRRPRLALRSRAPRARAGRSIKFFMGQPFLAVLSLTRATWTSAPRLNKPSHNSAKQTCPPSRWPRSCSSSTSSGATARGSTRILKQSSTSQMRIASSS